ncbi:MAG: hypothetical protein R3B13_00235 [Polyangiaceae bacterium]
MPFNCLIMGAAGRDFHDFLTFFRRRPEFVLRAFTATQIPFISERRFPTALAGPEYADGVPIHLEEELPELIRRYAIDFVFFAYSDIPYADLMHRQSIAQAAGASFVVLGPRHTELTASKPVVSVTAVRTGAGKSPLSQHLALALRSQGKQVAVLRHPMPYGNLEKQGVQRFATAADLDLHQCTIEEREEYLPYVEMGVPLFAGVDYESILRAAEAEADVILWDGGNNDLPFVHPDVSIVVADALRPGHELGFYPGEANLRRADIVVVNKVASAKPEAVKQVRDNTARVNPGAEVIEADLDVRVDDGARMAGKRVLLVEDGPTLTHGGMSWGAARVAADRHGAAAIVDPRPHAVGSIADTFAAYPHLGAVLPALGYSERQRAELTETIRACAPDLVIDGSPARIESLSPVPVVRVHYAFAQQSGRPVAERVIERLGKVG